MSTLVRRTLLLGALALGLGVAVRIMTAPIPAAAVPGGDASPAGETQYLLGMGGDGRPRWRHLWTRPAPGLASLSVAADGSAVAWVDGNGSVRRINGGTGATLWQAPPVAGVNQVLASPAGPVVAYSRLNPSLCAVRIYDTRYGDRKSANLGLQGAVWAATLSQDGTKAVIGTGAHQIYLVPLTKPDPAPAEAAKPSVWTTVGIPDSVALANGKLLAVFSTWQETGVSACELPGQGNGAVQRRWRYSDPQVDRTYRVTLSADGSTAVGFSARGPRGKDARLDAWDARTGHLLWRENIEGREPRVIVSENGKYIAVSYARMSYYRTGDEALEYKLALFDRAGNRLFSDKGSALFRPQLVALSQDGTRLTVNAGQGTLFTLDAQGNFLSRQRLATDPKTGNSPTIKEAVSSPDGRYLLLWRGDGQISLFKAAAAT